MLNSYTSIQALDGGKMAKILWDKQPAFDMNKENWLNVLERTQPFWRVKYTSKV